MTKQKPLYLFHLLALCIVCVWGTTFVSTKTLISNGLTPTEIFIYRFALAYSAFCLWRLVGFLPTRLPTR